MRMKLAIVLKVQPFSDVAQANNLSFDRDQCSTIYAPKTRSVGHCQREHAPKE